MCGFEAYKSPWVVSPQHDHTIIADSCSQQLICHCLESHCWSVGWELSTCIPWPRDPWKACRLRALSVIYEFRGVWNLRSIIGATDLLVIRARCYGIPLIKHMQRSGKGALRQFLAKNYLTAIFDTNKFMQGWDKSEVVHVWLRLLPKTDDPSTHKTIKCSSYCSCFQLISDTFSISYHGPSLRDPKAVMLLLSLVLWRS